jgi:hypothetical protein
MRPRSSKNALVVTVFDAHGNDVTARALKVAPPSSPPPEKFDELDEHNEKQDYGSLFTLRRQRILRALAARVWWHTGIAQEGHHR